MELPVDVIERARGSLVADSCARGFAPYHPLQTQIAHQARDSATSGDKALTVHLAPDLAHAINAEILGEDAHDLGLQILIPPSTRRSSRFSRSKAFSRSAISVGTPARLPLFTSAFLIHSN